MERIKQIEITAQRPLVSIAVITYNSSKFVIETLESAKAQTYQNIELIVSDDCSTDNTVELCRNWLLENGSRFVRTELITTLINTGVSANATRSRKAARGEWVKGIAGDDILVEDAIEKFIALEKSDDSYLFFGRHKRFSTDENGRKVFDITDYPTIEDSKIFDCNVEEQYRMLFYRNYFIAPSSFVRNSLYGKIGYYDESFPMIEDWPFWLKCLKAGYRAEYAPILVAYYRQHSLGISSSIRATWYNKAFSHDVFAFKRKYILPNVSITSCVFWKRHICNRIRYFIFAYVFGNKKTKSALMFDEILKKISLFKLKFIKK